MCVVVGKFCAVPLSCTIGEGVYRKIAATLHVCKVGVISHNEIPLAEFACYLLKQGHAALSSVSSNLEEILRLSR